MKICVYADCPKAGELQAEENFRLAKGKPHAYCKPCQTSYNRKYKEKNKEHVQQLMSVWNEKNFSRRQEKARQYKKEYPEKIMLGQARIRARDKGLAFNLTEEFLRGLIVATKVCPVFGTRLSYGESRGKQLPDSASLDRVDPTRGYIENSVRIISWRANEIKKDASKEELRQILTYMERESG